MSSTPILLILGSGSNIGRGVAEAFKAKGYNLALVSRSISEETSTPTELHIQADLSDPSVVLKIFTKVKEVFGSPPSVVVYNGTCLLPSSSVLRLLTPTSLQPHTQSTHRTPRHLPSTTRARHGSRHSHIPAFLQRSPLPLTILCAPLPI
jgi:NAD(P)-dependent dehydrogenase (short-subunit alcohol dehydrogenase family)